MHLYRSRSAARFLAPRLRPLMQARVFAGVEHAHANLLRKVADARSGRLTGADPTYCPANLMSWTLETEYGLGPWCPNC